MICTFRSLSIMINKYVRDTLDKPDTKLWYCHFKNSYLINMHAILKKNFCALRLVVATIKFILLRCGRLADYEK